MKSEDSPWWEMTVSRWAERIRRWRRAVARGLRRSAAVVANALPGLVRDTLIFGGLAALGYGAWMAWEPAGPMVVGAGSLLMGVFGVPSRGDQNR